MCIGLGAVGSGSLASGSAGVGELDSMHMLLVTVEYLREHARVGVASVPFGTALALPVETPGLDVAASAYHIRPDMLVP